MPTVGQTQQIMNLADATPSMTIGGIVGGVAYVCYSIVFDSVVMPVLVPPGTPMLSYGQQWGMIMLPFAAVLGAACGAGSYFAFRRQLVLAVSLPIASAALIAVATCGIWRGNIARYGDDPTDLILFFPLLVGCAITAALGVIIPVSALYFMRK